MQQELQEWTNATMMRSRLSKIRGRAKFVGVATLTSGDVIQVAGVGDRFNGKAFVTAVRHEVGDGTWDTHIQFGLDPERYACLYTDVIDTEASGLIGGIKGLQIGIVVQLQNDPEGQDRILVKVPVIDDTAKGTWMRVATLDAGNDRGAFFRPEIHDEVIVGFINTMVRANGFLFAVYIRNGVSQVEPDVFFSIPIKTGHCEVVGRFSGKVFAKMNAIIGRTGFFTKNNDFKLPGLGFGC